MERGILTAITLVVAAGGVAFVKASFDILKGGKKEDDKKGGK